MPPRADGGGAAPEPVGTTASAISVITGDDIRRSGVMTIADALQLADGVHVSRFNNGSWRITARGFNGATPNKLLVMVDGKTVYSPLFAGVFWNTVDDTACSSPPERSTSTTRSTEASCSRTSAPA